MIKVLKISSLVLMTLFIILFSRLESNAESLWRNQDMYADRRAHEVGDVVTIIISENATAVQEASNSRSKDLSIGGSSNANLDATATTGENATVGQESIGGKTTTFLNSLAELIPLFGASISGESSYDGANGSSRRGLLAARITVVVDEIDENGNLVLKGLKNVKINSEMQEIEIYGLCRADDINPDNTIDSNRIANACIRYNGHMQYSDDEKPGFFARVIDGIAELIF